MHWRPLNWHYNFMVNKVVHHFEIPGVKILPLRHKDAKNEYLLSLRLSAFAVINSNRCSTVNNPVLVFSKI